MLLYHGTRGFLGEQILLDGRIKSNVKREFQFAHSVNINGCDINLSSTQGFVYLSNDVVFAATSGSVNAYKHYENKIYVFEVDLDESILLPDYDQLNIESIRRNRPVSPITSARDSLVNCHSAVLPYDIDFKQVQARYFIMPSTMYGQDVTKEQAIFTHTILHSPSPYWDGVGAFEEGYGYALAIEYFKTVTWHAIP